MPTLEPTVALNQVEGALRSLLQGVLPEALGPEWLARVATPERLSHWAARAEAERRRLARGLVAVPESGLAYAEFYELKDIVLRQWQHLAPALGDQRTTRVLLERVEALRNTVAHNRPLGLYEADLLSGIAGLIRNQVTLFMSSQDPAGDYYPRIESVVDSLGHTINGYGSTEVAGSYDTATSGLVLHPGDVITIACNGTDPQDRPLSWTLIAAHRRAGDDVTGPSGVPVELQWRVRDEDVSEHTAVEVRMRIADSAYHRAGSFDQRVYFMYAVRPPL